MMATSSRLLLPMLFISCVLVGTGACRRSDNRETAAFEARPNAQRFPLTGRVVSVEPSERSVTVAHDEIEGFMKAMTMQFPVKEQWALETMAPNDRVTATLVVDGQRSWLQDVVVTRGSDSGGSASPSGAPARGTKLPELSLVDRNDRPVRTTAFTGRVSVVTFIYTRCPLPDYCPLMMRRFAETAKQLRGRTDPAPPTQLVAVTVDPEYDTPEVLRAYAARVTTHGSAQKREPSRGHVTWRFLTGTPDNIRAFARFFGLFYEQQGDGIMHALRTAVIDPHGRVVTVLRGNEWSAADLVQHIDAAAKHVASASRAAS